MAMNDPSVAVQYGKHVLSFVRTECTHETIYDPSHTDNIGTKFRLTVNAHLSRGLDPGKSSETGPETEARVRHDFLRPRQYLVYRVGGKTVLEVGKPEDAAADRQVVDIANGPLPVSFKMVSVTEATIGIEWTVETTILDCDSTITKDRGFLSHRWKEREQFDKFGNCTYEVTGLIIFRSDIISNPTEKIDEILGKQPVRPGYQRQDWHFEVEESGLRLSYRFIEREAPSRQPPEGTLEMRCRLRFATNTTGVAAVGHLSMMVKGDKKTTRRNLLIAMSRIYNFAVDRFSLTGKDTRPPVNSLALEAELIEENMLSLDAMFTVDLKKIMPAAGGKERKQTQERSPLERAGRAAIGVIPGIGLPIQIQDAAEFGGNLLQNDEQPDANAPARFQFFDYNVFEFSLPGCNDKDQRGIAPRLRGNHQFLSMLSATFWDPCYKTPERLVTTELRGGPSSGIGETSLSGSSRGGSGGSGNGPMLPNPSASGSSATLYGSAASGLPPLFTSNNPGSLGAVSTAPGEAVNKSLAPSANPFPPQGRAPASIAIVERVDPFEVTEDTPTPYQTYDIEVVVHDVTGQVTLGTTKFNQPRQVVQMCAPYIRMEVSFYASRIGERPEIPDPCQNVRIPRRPSTGTATSPPSPPQEKCNFVLTSKKFSTNGLVRVPTGGYKYVIAGLYRYDVIDATKFNLFEPLPPFIIGDIKGTKKGQQPYKPRREGLYNLVNEIIWYRLKTLKPSTFAELCHCDTTTGTNAGGSPMTEEQTLRQTAGAGVDGELRQVGGDDPGFVDIGTLITVPNPNVIPASSP